MPRWAPVVAVLLLALVLVGAFKVFDRLTDFRSVPPTEAIAFERTVLNDEGIELHVRNDGPTDVTVAQLLVNNAYWDFSITRPTLGRLQTAVITSNYPWEEGMPLNISIVTSTGVTLSHDIPLAAGTPEGDGGTLLTFTLLGIYIGVIPIAIGLFAFPFLRRISRGWLGFFLAFTVGLLAFLLVDTLGEGIDLASAAPASLNGLALFAMGALGSVIVLFWLGEHLAERGRQAKESNSGSSAMTLAYFVAIGIGLHNMGEGLAVGAALATGETALGTFLIVGFALHNTTEGLAIVAPLGAAPERPRLRHFLLLGAIAGIPTIFGAWIGGFAYSPGFAVFAFGIAAGAIAQVIWAIAHSMRGEAALDKGLPAAGFVTGLAVMYATGLLV
jgi:zinc transporter ZupT